MGGFSCKNSEIPVHQVQQAMGCDGGRHAAFGYRPGCIRQRGLDRRMRTEAVAQAAVDELPRSDLPIALLLLQFD